MIMLLALYVLAAWLGASIPTTALFAVLFRGADNLAAAAR
jgi:hypothetical protein